MGDGPAVLNDLPAGKSARVPEIHPNLWQEVCFVILCAYLLSGFVNEFALRLIHGKAYISNISLVLLPGAFLVTGSAFRGARVSFGKWWIAFGLWLGICAPFSVWKGDTASLLLNYFFRSYLLYFVICACVVTLGRIRTLMYVFGIGNLLIVLNCFAFGSVGGGRLTVAGSNFSSFANANELGLQLLLGIPVFLFAFLRGGKFLKVLSMIFIALSVVYMLRTGSRGAFVAALAVMIVFLWFNRIKIKTLTAVLLLFVIALVLLPSSARHRLTYFAIGDDRRVADKEDASALESQIEREQLFWDSVSITLRHPLVGVGPGEFMIEDVRESEKKGERPAWRQTHNSYTQVSSEAGIPGFVFYVCSILSCLGLNHRVYRRTAGKKGLEDYAGLSLCMLLSTVGYAVGTIFDHLAYTGYLPIIGGITVVTYFATRRALRALKHEEPGTTNVPDVGEPA